MSTAANTRVCTPPTGWLLWSLEESVDVRFDGDTATFTSHNGESRCLARTPWMPEVVARLSLGPVDLGNVSALAQDAKRWRGEAVSDSQSMKLWPEVRNFLDELGALIVPWYCPPGGLRPILSMPAKGSAPVPFTLGEVPYGAAAFLSADVCIERDRASITISSPGGTRVTRVVDQPLIDDLLLGVNGAELKPQRCSSAVHRDVVRCLLGANLAVLEGADAA